MRDFKGLPSRAARPLAWVMLSVYLIACPVLAQSLEVIDLKYRTAAEVIPVLQPLLEQGGALTGQDYKLFVRASPANVRAAARRVRPDRPQAEPAAGVGASKHAAGDRARARASRAAPSSNRGSNVSVQRDGLNARDRNDGVASVQVIEGSSAFISSGSDVPIVTAVAAGGGRRPWAAATTEYRNLSSGFLVTPRVNGQTVVLDIEQQDERVVNGNVQTQHLTTQVSGALGEWIRSAASASPRRVSSAASSAASTRRRATSARSG